MLLYVFFRFLHFVAIFGVTAAVIIENIAVKPSISKEDAINLAKISLIDNVSLLLTLMAGLYALVLGGKTFRVLYRKSCLFSKINHLFYHSSFWIFSL